MPAISIKMAFLFFKKKMIDPSSNYWAGRVWGSLSGAVRGRQDDMCRPKDKWREHCPQRHDGSSLGLIEQDSGSVDSVPPTLKKKSKE